MSKPLILVTNDDGILAPGIRALVDVAATFGEVVVVAPDSPQSGQGHAITIENPIRLKKVHFIEGVETYECSGTPVDCVKLAKYIVLKDRKIDLCLSGINHGSNNSINVVYSGTMSAAMEASIEGIKSIGFSLLDHSFDADFDQSKLIAKNIIAKFLKNDSFKANLLNVNIPAKQPIKGIKICRQCKGYWAEEFKQGLDPRGQEYYWLSGKFVNTDEGEDTDIYAVKNGYVSVVPTMHDLTDYNALAELDFIDEEFKLMV